MRKISSIPCSHEQTLNRLLLLGSRHKGRTLAAGALVRAVRTRLNMTQRQLARRAGVPQAHVARIEKGRLDPRMGTIERLLAAMRCELVLLPRAPTRLGDVLYEQVERARHQWHWRKDLLMQHPSALIWNE